MDYPVFNVEVETTNDGVWAISLVDAPAVDSEFLLFSKQEKPENKQFNFSIENEEKHNILGCVLRADYPIYRYDSERGEYYLNFSKEVIEKMTAKMLKLGTFKNVDLNHDENYDVEGMSLLQMFIKDSEKGINPVGFEDVADGSLFAVYHVDSFDLWNEIKEGKFNGFSVEAFLTIYEQFNKTAEEPVEEEQSNEEPADTAEEQDTEEIDVEVELDENDNEETEETTEEVASDDITTTEENSIVEAIKEAFSAHNVVETEEGIKIFYVDDEIAVGSKLTDESGNAIGNGEYTINGKTYKVEDGQVTEIIEPAEEESNEEPADTVEETTDVEETTEEPAEEQPEETETVEEVAQEEQEEQPAENVEEQDNEDNSEIETAEGSSNEIATLKATIEALKAEIEALKAEITKPAAPTVEEFSRSGNKGESKAESMLDYLYSIRKH